MRVLIVFHGRLPGGPWPVAGIALRAWTNGLGLAAHGADVHYASRRRDLLEVPPPGQPVVHPFEDALELRALVARLAPDLILAEGVDEMHSLEPTGVPIAVDLFAPRVLEAQFQGVEVAREQLTLLDALARADYYLVTTERQRYYYLGLLPLAGVDCREDRFATVPLSVPEKLPGKSLSEVPLLVAGGVAWPWQDPRWALESVVKHLKAAGRGRLELFRGPYPLAGDGADGADAVPPLPVPAEDPVQVRGLLPYPEMLERYSQAWCAIDLMAPNLEREMALSFRQLDALAAGVPLLMGTHAPLAALVSEYQAGWVIAYGDEAAMARVMGEILHEPASVQARCANAQRLARDHFSAARAVRPLFDRVQKPSRRTRLETLPAALARKGVEADAQRQRLQALERAEVQSGIDLTKKSAEVEQLNAQVGTLTRSVSHLSAALEDALAFQRERSVGHEQAQVEAKASRASLERELATLNRELARKEAVRIQLMSERDGLEADLEAHRAQEAASRLRFEAQTGERAALAALLRDRDDALHLARLELEALRADRDKKQRELEASWKIRESLKADLEFLIKEKQEQDALELEEGQPTRHVVGPGGRVP